MRQALPAIRTLARELSMAPLASSCTCGHVSIAHGSHGQGRCHGRKGRWACPCTTFAGWYPNRAKDFERFGKQLLNRLEAQGLQLVRTKVKKKKKET